MLNINTHDLEEFALVNEKTVFDGKTPKGRYWLVYKAYGKAVYVKKNGDHSRIKVTLEQLEKRLKNAPQYTALPFKALRAKAPSTWDRALLNLEAEKYIVVWNNTVYRMGGKPFRGYAIIEEKRPFAKYIDRHGYPCTASVDGLKEELRGYQYSFPNKTGEDYFKILPIEVLNV